MFQVKYYFRALGLLDTKVALIGIWIEGVSLNCHRGLLENVEVAGGEPLGFEGLAERLLVILRPMTKDYDRDRHYENFPKKINPFEIIMQNIWNYRS